MKIDMQLNKETKPIIEYNTCIKEVRKSLMEGRKFSKKKLWNGFGVFFLTLGDLLHIIRSRVILSLKVQELHSYLCFFFV